MAKPDEWSPCHSLGFRRTVIPIELKAFIKVLMIQVCALPGALYFSNAINSHDYYILIVLLVLFAASCYSIITMHKALTKATVSAVGKVFYLLFSYMVSLVVPLFVCCFILYAHAWAVVGWR